MRAIVAEVGRIRCSSAAAFATSKASTLAVRRRRSCHRGHRGGRESTSSRRRAATRFPAASWSASTRAADEVAVAGWTEVSGVDAADASGATGGAACGAIVYTDIARDGTLRGRARGRRHGAARGPRRRSVAGGIGSVGLRCARCASCASQSRGVIVGKALYERRFDLAEARPRSRGGADVLHASASSRAWTSTAGGSSRASLRRPPRRRRSGRAGGALRPRGRRRARLPRHHGHLGRARARSSSSPPDSRQRLHPVHSRRRGPGVADAQACSTPAPTRSRSTPRRSPTRS